MKTIKRPAALTALFAILLAAVATGSAEGQSLWDPNGNKANLIADNVARKKGDILTILVDENHQVEDKQDVTLEKESTLDWELESFNIKPNAFQPLPDLKNTSTNDFEGTADYDKEGKFQARITVNIIDVMPNGNLVIEGRRNIFKDEEEQTIKITGVVRPLDITAENTVTSDKVSDARISYDGEGELSQSTKRNWFDKLISFIWPW